MYCRFGHNVGIQAVAEVDGVDVVTTIVVSSSVLDVVKSQPAISRTDVRLTTPDRCT